MAVTISGSGMLKVGCDQLGRVSYVVDIEPMIGWMHGRGTIDGDSAALNDACRRGSVLVVRDDTGLPMPIAVRSLRTECVADVWLDGPTDLP